MPNEPTSEYLAQRRAEIENALARGDNGAAIVVINQMCHDGYAQHATVLIDQIRTSHQ